MLNTSSDIDKILLWNLTLLYVEDEKLIAEEVNFFLSRYIKNIHIAYDGEEGERLFNKVKPDIIITDIQMPKQNGLKMIKNINTKNVPVIITTAFSDVEYFIEALELNINKYIMKPIDLKKLLEDIQECVAINNIKNELFKRDNLLNIINTNILLSITNTNGIIIEVSDAFCKFVGYTKEEIINNSHAVFRHKDTPNSFYKNLWSTIKNGKVFKADIKNIKKNGEVYFINIRITPVFKDNRIINYIAISENITDKKKLELLVIEDDLTKLYNRRYFNEILNKEMRRIKRNKGILHMLILDIDYFKKYNDTYGHPKGDEALIIVANIFKASMTRASDYAFRLGGEEFCLIYTDMTKAESIQLAQKIVKNVENLEIKHKTSLISEYLTISAGLIMQDISTIDEKLLYKNADEALYLAKTNGRNKVVISKHCVK